MSSHSARQHPPAAGGDRGTGTGRALRVVARAGSVTAFALAGMLFTTSALTADGTDLRATGRTNLPDLIRDRESSVTRLERSVTAARDRLAALTAAQGSTQVDAALAAAALVAPQAGLTEVTGPALTVMLDDSDSAPRAGEVTDGLTLDDYIVHQQDVEGVINALWEGGAEAMMIMDQRVIGTSAVRCVGNVLSLQGRTYSPPYSISAIGDIEGMTLALARSEPVSIYREYVDVLGLGFDVSFAEPEMTFPPYVGTLSLQFARADEPDDGQQFG